MGSVYSTLTVGICCGRRNIHIHQSATNAKNAYFGKLSDGLPAGGIGDFRESCLDIRDEYGCLGTEILYKEHRIYSGKTPLEGLPASFVTASQMDTEDAGTAVQTLEVICQDRVLGVEVVLSYTAFEREDVITRSVRVDNRGEQTLTIEKIYSACLDMDYEEDYELLTLPGAWARERRIQRRRIGYGRQSAASIRGDPGIRSIRLLHWSHRVQRRPEEMYMQCILYIPAIFWDRWKCRSMT